MTGRAHPGLVRSSIPRHGIVATWTGPAAKTIRAAIGRARNRQTVERLGLR